jgi:hypothetical protein
MHPPTTRTPLYQNILVAEVDVNMGEKIAELDLYIQKTRSLDPFLFLL